MEKRYFILILILVTVIIPAYLNAQSTNVFMQEGIASWYGKEFEGRPTASGELFDPSQLTAAHPNLPFGTMVVVTNQHNNKKVTVRINDRGPFVSARIIDVSRAAAEKLDMIVTGTAPVAVESIDRIVITQPAVNQSYKDQSNIRQPLAESAIPASVITVNLSQPVVTKFTPEISIIPERKYRLQIGSYKVAKNAINVFEKLKSTGLNPAYERFINSDSSEYFRVVLAGISGFDINLTAEKLGAAGFREALIREEN
ncbi:MAG: septal ring lytic transglycosylase RlpA family protein [Treponema sp.]|nr:septal ring lytic transglycosylase RlpA family protein [Treponema sp.]